MSAELEIKLIDAAGPAPIGAAPPPGAGQFVTAPPVAQAATSTSLVPVGPKAAGELGGAEQGRELTTVGEGLRALTGALGHGSGLLSATQLLHRSFTELSQAVSDAAASQGSRLLPAVTHAPPGAGLPALAPSSPNAPPAWAETRATATAVTAAPEGAGGGEATAAVAGVGRLAAAAGPAVLAIGALTAGVGLATATVSKFVDSMKAEAEKLSEYSPELANATANSEIREMMSEMRRAEENGPQMAKFEEARSRIQQQYYDVMTRIEGWLLEKVTPVLQYIANIGPIMGAQFDVVVAQLKVMIDQFAEFFGGKGFFDNEVVELQKATENLVKVTKETFDAQRDNDGDAGEDMFLRELMEMNPHGQLFGPQIPRRRMAPGL